MTTVIRRKRALRSSIGPHRRHELLTGSHTVSCARLHRIRRRCRLGPDGIHQRPDARGLGSQSRRAMPFWKSGAYTTSGAFPDSLPWLFVCGSADTLPWAAVHLD
jgi:hypothetical protein